MKREYTEWVVILIIMIIALAQTSCKTHRTVSDNTVIVNKDSIEHILKENELRRHKETEADSLVRKLVEHITNYQSKEVIRDTIVHDSIVRIVDTEGNVISTNQYNKQIIHDYRRDTLLVYRNVVDSTSIISRYNDSIYAYKNEIDSLTNIVNNTKESNTIVERVESWWDKIISYWKHILITIGILGIISLAVKYYFNRKNNG